MLRRALSPLALFGTMFVLHGAAPYGTEEVVPMAGPGLAILVLAAMALVWALPYVLVVSELVSAMPEEGGLYRWYRAALGPFGSFLITCADICTWVLDSALYPPLIAAYLVTLFTPRAEHWVTWLVGLPFIWGCTWMNIRGIRLVGGFSLFLSVLVTAPMLVVTWLGLQRFSFSQLGSFAVEEQPLGSSLHHALIWGAWHYSGYSGLASAGEEIMDTRRNYPRVLVIFLCLSTVLFILPLLASLGATPEWSSWRTAHFNTVALVLGGAGLAACMALAAQLGALGIFNAELTVTSRLGWAMARDGLLPRTLARLHPRHATPHILLILQAVLYSLLTFFFEFVELLRFGVWLFMIPFLVLMATPVVLRLKRPELSGKFRIPGGWPVLALVVLPPSALAVTILAGAAFKELLFCLGVIALWPLLYLFSRRWWQRSPPC
jgi:amino acid transporter